VLPGILELERLVLRTHGIDGIVLRYGLLYGPGTGRDGPSPGDAARVHVADAARAAALAVDAPLGIYNIVDDGGSVSNARARRTLGCLECVCVSGVFGRGCCTNKDSAAGGTGETIPR
jgi:hypothetical protein